MLNPCGTMRTCKHDICTHNVHSYIKKKSNLFLNRKIGHLCHQRMSINLHDGRALYNVKELDSITVEHSNSEQQGFICLLVASCPSNMLEYLSDRFAKTPLCAATLRWNLNLNSIKFAIKS